MKADPDPSDQMSRNADNPKPHRLTGFPKPVGKTLSTFPYLSVHLFWFLTKGNQLNLHDGFLILNEISFT